MTPFLRLLYKVTEWLHTWTCSKCIIWIQVYFPFFLFPKIIWKKLPIFQPISFPFRQASEWNKLHSSISLRRNLEGCELNVAADCVSIIISDGFWQSFRLGSTKSKTHFIFSCRESNKTIKIVVFQT